MVEERLLPPVTRTVKLDVPDAVGVPLITPPPLRPRPAGRLPEASDHAYGVVPPLSRQRHAVGASRCHQAGDLNVVMVGGTGFAACTVTLTGLAVAPGAVTRIVAVRCAPPAGFASKPTVIVPALTPLAPEVIRAHAQATSAVQFIVPEPVFAH